MRDLQSYVLLLLVITALPACGQLLSTSEEVPLPSRTEPDPGMNLINGSYPRSGAVFCDIERIGARRCAAAEDKARGIPLERAAIALNAGGHYPFALDYSAASKMKCNGEPEVVVFQGLFPDGLPVCVNCGDVLGPGKAYPEPNALCRAKCLDFFQGPPDEKGNTLPVKPPTAEALAFCGAFARASTNALAGPLGCFADACNAPDTETRRVPEPVVWADLKGVTAGGAQGNDLQRTTDMTGDWDAGAVSAQWIRSGDAFVDFEVGIPNAYIGVTTIPESCAEPCEDKDPGIGSIGYALYVHRDGSVFIYEAGQRIDGPNITFGTAQPGDRFRIHIASDRQNNTATVYYAKVNGPCFPGAPCNTTILRTSPVVAKYPFRVDTSLHDKGTTIRDVDLVRIR